MAKKRKRHSGQERALLDPQTALDIIDDDLPDGAYWALLEEMTGLEPAEIVEFIEARTALRAQEGAK